MRISAPVSAAALLLALFTASAPADATIPPTPASMASISIGDGFSLIIGSDGMPYGAGTNGAGQLTGANTADKTTLVPLTGLPSGVKALAVSAQGANSFVLGTDHLVYGAGANQYGQLANLPHPTTTLTPLAGQPSDGIVAVDGSSDGSVFISSTGALYYTGLNRSARFGPDSAAKTALTAIPMPVGITAVDAEVAFGNLYVLGSDHNVYAMGSNPNGPGPGAVGGPPVSTLTQMPVNGSTPVSAISASDENVIALGTDGNVYGAGINSNGEVGQGGQHNGLVVSALTGMPSGTATAIAEGNNFTLVLGQDGRVYSTGDNSYDQLSGRHSTDQYQLAPMADAIPGDVTAISAGVLGSLMTDADGIVYGAGRNDHGQITGANVGVQELRVLAGQLITNLTAPSISGTAQFTKTLTAAKGTWTPSPQEYTYDWRLNGNSIAGADTSTYAPVSTDIGGRITVVVTAKRGRFASQSWESAPTAAVAKGPALVYNSSVKPKVYGTLTSGHTLRISRTTTQLRAGFSPDASTLAYRWYRGSSAISGATHSTYKLTSKDKGKKVRVRIYGARTSYSTGSYLTATVTIKR